jgi:hypothetical protein
LSRRTRDSERGRGWRQGQRDPKDDVDEETGAGEEDGEQPNDADEGWIEIEIVGEARTDTTDLFVAAGAHQALDWRCVAGGLSGLAGQLGAAVVAKLGTFSDFFLAFRAKHGSPPQSNVQSHSKQRYEIWGRKVSMAPEGA